MNLEPNSRRRRIGISTVIGTMIFLLVAVLVFATFGAVISKSLSVNQANQASENQLVSRGKELAQVAGSLDNVTVQNTGSASILVVKSFGVFANGSFFVHQFPAPYSISPGNSASMTLGLPSPTSQFTPTGVITSLGNIFYTNAAGSNPDVVGGSLTFAPKSFKFYPAAATTAYLGDGYQLGGYSVYLAANGGGFAYAGGIPKNTPVIFELPFQNVDPKGRNVTLSQYSAITIAGTTWYIVGGVTASNSGRLNDFYPTCKTGMYTCGVSYFPYIASPGITIPYGKNATLYFGASSPCLPINTTDSCGTQRLTSNPPSTVTLLAVGTYDDGTLFAGTMNSGFAYFNSATACLSNEFSSTRLTCSVNPPASGPFAAAGPYGTPITLGYTGFSSNPVVYWFNRDGTTKIVSTDSTSSACTATSITGLLCGTVTFEIPPNQQPGFYQIAVSDQVLSYVYGTVQVTVPTIGLTPGGGPVGTTVAVAGSNYVPSSPVTVTFGGSTVAKTTATSAGAISTSFLVPTEPTLGPYTVVATDSSGNSATTTFSVSLATLSITISSGPAGSLLGLSGNGYASGVSYSYCLSKSATAASCIGTAGSFTAQTDGTIPSGKTLLVPSGTAPSSDYMVAYSGSTLYSSASFTVTVASLSVSPGNGPPGISVLLDGSSFAPNTSYSYCLSTSATSTASCIGTPGTNKTDGSGRIVSGTSLTIPSTAAGSDYILVYQVSSVVVTSAGFTVTSAISLSPTTGPIYTVVSASGSGFAKSATVSLTYDGNPLTTTPASCTTGSTGSFSCSFTVPASGVGAHVVKATDSAKNSASKSFTVVISVSLSPASGPVGSAVTATGTSFAFGSPMTIRFDGVIQTTTTTGSTGSFSCSFTVPESVGGPHTVNATDASSNSVLRTFTVTAFIALSPTSGPPGQTVTVTGNGFSASATYSDCISTSATSVNCVTGSTGSFTSDGSGNIPSGTTVTVPSGTASGSYYVITYSGGTVAASAAFTVKATPTVSTSLSLSASSLDCSASGGSLLNSVTTSPMTCKAGDVIVIMIVENYHHTVTGTGITDSAGLLSGWHERPGLPACIGTCSSTGLLVDEWWTVASSALSSDKITVPFSGSSDHNYAIVAFGISGASTTTPFDPNSGLVYTSSCTSSCNTVPTVTGVSTSNANDIIIGFEGQIGGSAETAATGYSLITPQSDSSSNNVWGAVEYETVAATQSGLKVSFGSATGSTSGWIMIADAVESATVSTNTITAGQSAYDSATLSGATSNAGGTVQYEYFSTSGCSGAATNVGTPVTVASAAVPTSIAQSFSTEGFYGWEAVYSGDANNVGTTSACEPLTVQGFSVSASPSSVTFNGGSSGTSTVTVTSVDGFPGTVGLSSSVSPSTGLTASFSPTSVTLGASGTSTLTLSSSTPGTYSVTITGTSGSLVRTASVTVTVIAVTQPIKVTMAGSAPSAAVTVSGCSPSPSSFSSDGAVHNILVVPSCAFTLSFSNTGSSRDGFSVSHAFSATYTNQSCASGTCPEIDLTAHLQYQNTFQITAKAQTTFDASSTAAVTGTQLGAAATLCTLTTAAAATASCASVWSDYSAVATFPPTLTGTCTNCRWENAANGGSNTAAITSGGSTLNVNYYKQWTNTFSFNPSAPTTFDGSINMSATGTYLGTAGTAICTITLGASPLAGAQTCSGYSDSGATVTFANPTGVAPGTRWQPTAASSPTAAITSGGTTKTGNYYKQVQNTFQISANAQAAFDSGFTAAITGTQFGSGVTLCTVTTTAAATASCAPIWSDYNAVATFPASLSGTCTNCRWENAANGASSTAGLTTGGVTVGVNYYKQYSYTLSYSVTGGGSPTAPTLTSTQFGASYTPTLTSSGTAYWLDKSATCSTTDPTSNSGSTERWDTATACPTVSTAQTIVFAYYNQYLYTLSYSVTGGGSPTAPTLTSTQFGGSYTPTLTGTPTAYWLDYGGGAVAWSVTNPLGTSTSSERWDTSATVSGTVSTALTSTLAYYNQYACTCSYSGTVAPSGAPSFSRPVFGSVTATALTTTPTTLWADNSGAYTITKPATDFPSATERYETNAANGTVSSVLTVAPAFNHQWFVTFAASPGGSGSTSPSGSQWETDGSVSVSASANAGYSFSSWSSSTGSITFASSTSASTTATVHAAGTITASFGAFSTTTISCNPASPNVGSGSACTATVAGNGTPTGTVTFATSGSGSFTPSGTCTLTGGTCSVTYTPSSAGTVTITGSYSGDSSFGGSSGTFSLTVNKMSPTISTTLSATTITAGGSTHDGATLSSMTSNAGGTVQYEYFSGGSCSGTATNVGSAVTVTNGAVPNSQSQTFSSAGSYSWEAVYSGDSNNNGATSGCEPLTVNKMSPTISTTLSATTITAGGSTHDGATLSSMTSNAGGTVQYEYFSGGSCSGTATNVGSAVTVTNGAVPNSQSQTFSTQGSYGWEAVYSGDSNNNGATSGCEPLTVKTNPTISTTLSATSITAGSSVTDSATLASMTSNAGGTVQYEYFASSTCSGTATNVGSAVTVTNGAVPNSQSQTFSTQGSYGWEAVYSGDSNNNGATSGCEPLTVTDFSMSASPTSVTATAGGSSKTSTITVTSLNGFTGTVSLSATVSPSSGLAAGLSPTSVALGSSGTSTLTVTGTTAGTYTVTITGTSGSITHTATVTVTVVTFGMDPNSNSHGMVEGFGSHQSFSISTTNPGDVVYACEYTASTGLTFGISDASSLTWVSRGTVSNNGEMQCWYAIASSALTSDSITVTGGSYSGTVLSVFAVSGANTASPFDISSAATNYGSAGSAGKSSTVSVTTSHSNTIVVGIVGTSNGETISAGSGFTALNSNNAGPSGATEYKSLTSAQNIAATFSWGSNANWVTMADAFVMG